MHDNADDPSAGPAPAACEAGVRGAAPLAAEHFALYEFARTHLKALATSTPATSPLDYWDVLERVDDLHDPFARMAARRAPASSRATHYAQARAAIVGLARCHLDPEQVADAAARLDALWAADPDHDEPTGTPSPATVPGGAR